MTLKSVDKASIVIAVATGLLLLLPLVAMQFTSEVSWGAGDFAAAAALIYGAGMTYVVAARRVGSNTQRAMIAAAVLVILGLVWTELAVGLFQ